MKIVYLTPTYPPYPGGIGVAALYLAKEMARRGHDVVVCTPQYQGSVSTVEHRDGVAVHFLKPRFKYGNAAFVPEVQSLIRDCDVVHCYYPFFGGLEVAAYARARGARFALIVHHEMDTVGTGLLRWVFALHERCVMPWILKHTDAFASLSEDYLKHSPLLTTAERVGVPVAVVPNGVDVDMFSSRVSERSLHEIPRLILVAGLDRAHYFKGVPLLIRALARLGRQGITVALTIVGEGDMRAEYEALAKKELVHDRITFTGLVQHDRLPAVLDEHDVFVMPSTATTESFCIAAAEAQAVGLPAIVSDLPGLRQTVGIGETGAVFPMGDERALAEAVASMISDPGRYVAYARAARDRMKARFAWPIVADAALAVYTDALARRKSL